MTPLQRDIYALSNGRLGSVLSSRHAFEMLAWGRLFWLPPPDAPKKDAGYLFRARLDARIVKPPRY